MEKVVAKSLEVWSERREEILQASKESREERGIWPVPKHLRTYYYKLRRNGSSYEEAKAEVKKVMEKENRK